MMTFELRISKSLLDQAHTTFIAPDEQQRAMTKKAKDGTPDHSMCGYACGRLSTLPNGFVRCGSLSMRRCPTRRNWD
jgi:hypothetical protein